jgi:tRNA (cmo5U34)-methyltransferase
MVLALEFTKLALNEYATPEHALAYLAKADKIPHRTEGESVLLSFVPTGTRRILDLGTGDGRLLSILAPHCPTAECIGIDFSQTMIDAARQRFVDTPRVDIRMHDLDEQLPDLGEFDAIVSSFAIHHCSNERKKTLYTEIYDRLTPGSVFCNLEHVASPTPALHLRFLKSLGTTTEEEDPSNILLDVETQLDWLRTIGFEDVDCYWKWLELAMFGGFRGKL